MIAKMKYISITGHIASMNHVVNRYLSRYDIQLEQSSNALMTPFTTLNPYGQTLRKAEQFAETIGAPPLAYVPMPSAEAVNLVEAAATAYEQRDEQLQNLEKDLAEAQRKIEALQNFTSFNIPLEAATHWAFIHCKFGQLTATGFRRYERFLQNDEKIIFLIAKRENDYIYGAYFTPATHQDETDAAFAALEFQPLDIPSSKSTPAAMLHQLGLEIQQLTHEITALTYSTLDQVCKRDKLAIACAKVQSLYAAFDIKKYAAISHGRRVFTFSGWMSQDDATKLEAEIDSDDLAVFTHDATRDKNNEKLEPSRPPTLLKNLPIIRQFEFFTRLYGLPNYGEIDPTPILAITYTLLFGLMFGDIGHGLVLAFLGILVQRRWHSDLGGIMTIVGISAAGFGVLYGSIFGFEFNPLWMRPQADIMTTLIFAAALGAGLITLSMFLNMYNAFRRGRVGELLFGTNGLAGLMFYGAVLWILVRVLVHGQALTLPVIILAILPLAFVSFKHPLENLMAGRPFFNLKEGIGQFIFNTIIETFETLLTYATNTISFVRVGAFAVSHAGMMHVVLQLSSSAAGTQNIFILVLGNVLVIGIEGLLVGIQVLRLDFYEMFSRFYHGGGRAFESTSKPTKGY
ncbi:MAG: hypothetical protein FWE05_00295 [Defluviitaleaceae bacterium]|nr:hypothetical protein [Defluviitaleaceae bacterium]